MRNLLALAAAALIAFIVVGWFLGWYQISSTPTSSGTEYKVDLNGPKISKDISEGKEKLREALDKESKGTSAPSVSVPGIPASYQPGSSIVLPGGSIVPPSAPLQPVSTTPTQPRAVPPPLDTQGPPLVLPPPSTN